MVVDIFTAEFLVHTEFLKSVHHSRLHARQNHTDTTLAGHITDIPQILHPRRIDERHFAHTDYAHACVSIAPLLKFLRLGCETEEIRTVDFVYLHTLVDIKVLRVFKISLLVIFSCRNSRLIKYVLM